MHCDIQFGNQANISSYVKWDDIKEILEEKISNYNCINLGDIFYINDVIYSLLHYFKR